MTNEELMEVIKGEGEELTFTYKGHVCQIRRTLGLGILCGYVNYRGKLSQSFIENIDCHGGITYSKPGIIGFDCGHCFDVVPEMIKLMQEVNTEEIMEQFGKYRDMSYVKTECEHIVEQIIDHRMPLRRFFKWLGLWKN